MAFPLFTHWPFFSSSCIVRDVFGREGVPTIVRVPAKKPSVWEHETLSDLQLRASRREIRAGIITARAPLLGPVCACSQVSNPRHTALPSQPPQCTPGSVRPCHEHTIFLSQRCTEPSRQRKKVREAGQYCAISSQKRAGPGNSFQGKGGGFQRPGHRPQVDGLCQGALVPSEADAVWGGERRGHRCRQPPLSLFCGLLRRRAATPAR